MFACTKRPCTPGVILLLAAKSGNTTQVSTALQQPGVDPNTTIDARGYTPLHLAAIHGHAEVARVLLAANASTEITTPGDQLTPLRLAAERGYLQTVQVLLDFGADISARDAIDRATPLHAAAEAGHSLVVVELASSGADMEARAVSGQTPLRWAVSLGRFKAAVALLRLGADPDAPDRQGASCLHGIAALEERLEDWDNADDDSYSEVDRVTVGNGVSLGAQRGSVFPTRSHNVSRPELECESTCGLSFDIRSVSNSEHVSKQLESASDAGSPLTSRSGSDASDTSRLIISSTVGDSAIASAGALAELLLCSGAKVNFVKCPPPNSTGTSSPASAVENSVGSQRNDRHGTDSSNTISSAASSSASNGTVIGESPLHVAARESSVKVVQALLRAGADPNARTGPEDGGFTPLHCAAAPGGVRRRVVVRLLLAAGADVNAVSADGKTTPLRLACENAAVGCVEELLRWDGTPRSKDHDLVSSRHHPFRSLGRRRLLLHPASWPICPTILADSRAGSPSADKHPSPLPSLSAPFADSVGNEECDTESVVTGCAGVETGAVSGNGKRSAILHTAWGAVEGGGHAEETGQAIVGVTSNSLAPSRSRCRVRCPGAKNAATVLKPSEFKTLLKSLALNVGIRVPAAARDPTGEIRIQFLLRSAPADRAWRRRGWLMVLYSRQCRKRTLEVVSTAEEERQGIDRVGHMEDSVRALKWCFCFR